MTTTSQPDEGQGKEGSSPPQVPTPPSKEPQQVPLGEHIELRQELRKVSDELAKVQAQLAQAKKPEVPADPKAPYDVASLAKSIEQIQNRELLNSVANEIGIADQKKLEAVVALMREKGLDAREALSVAAMRDPQAFAASGQPTGAEPQYGSLTPRPGSSPQPKPDDAQRRGEYIQSLRGVDEKTRGVYLDNRIGHFLAEATGWDHGLLPLPQK